MHMDSTIAVHIAMIKFSEVTYNSAAQMVTIRAGLIWNDVYAGLDLYEVNVVGGRVTGVNVAGLTLGGSVSIVTEGVYFYVSATFPGCPWLTNQYGLTIVAVTAYELVLPTGAFVNITQYSNPSLFFALMVRFNP